VRHAFSLAILIFLAVAAPSLAAQEPSTPPAPGENEKPAAAPVPAFPAPPAGAPLNAILVSWDGCDRMVVWELLAKQKLPYLGGVIREGSLQEIEVKGHVTVTKPGHAEMLTGLGIEQTGVISNADFKPIPQGFTIFERMQDFLGGKDKIRTFMVTGKLAHVGGRGPDDVKTWFENQKGKKGRGKGRARKSEAPEGADDTTEGQSLGEPFYLTRNRLDVFDADQRDAGEVGPLHLKTLEELQSPRFLAFLHYSDPDHAGHKHSCDSREYREAAIACDFWLGKVVEWLRGKGLYEKTLLYVMTDHGFDDHAFGHGNAPRSWLATNDKAVTHGGILADVPATILWRFGVGLETLEPKLIGKPLAGPVPEVRIEKPKGKKRGKKGAAEPGEQSPAASPEEAKARIESRFRQADADGDGLVTLQEAPEKLRKSFARADADADGNLTLEEFEAFMKSRGARGGKGKQR